MQGYVARKGDRYGRLRILMRASTRSRNANAAAGIPPAPTVPLPKTSAKELADRRCRGGYERSSLTLAVYLTQRWLPSKQVTLRAST